ESNASGNGSLIVEGTATGSATVQRYFVGYTGADNGWHNIGSPVDNMAISGSDFDPGANDDLYQWDESSDTWENYKQGSFTNFVNGKGYLCAFENTGTKEFVGTLNTGDFTMTGLTKDSWGFNMLGNPYASALVWNNGDWTLTNVGAVAQIWEETNASYTAIAADGIIPSTNGFFVEVASAAGGSVTIPASARTHDVANNYKNTEITTYQETLDLRVSNDVNTFYDITRIGFRENATEAWDIQYDAHKLFGGSGTSQIWSVVNNENFVFNYLPYVYETYQVPIYFRAGVDAIHHINVEGIDSFFGNSEIYLEDLQTEEVINLNEQQMYSFMATTDDAENRFVLHFFGVTSVDEPNVADGEAKIYTVNQTVFIKFNTMTNSNSQVDVFNTIGQQVYTGQLTPQSLSSIQLNEKPGIYIVRLRTENGLTTQKVMIK
ncbi:MAG TPA: T9SS type A sorting domain-containing protein, partial [Bacteroidales bacterium]